MIISVRILPHFQDTGGFFIALLQKTGEIPGYAIPNEIKPQSSLGFEKKKGGKVSLDSDFGYRSVIK